MVLGGRVELYGGEYRSKVKVAYVDVPYFENQGNSLRFEVLNPSYTFSIRLFMVNYTPVTPLPSTSINSEFYLKLAYLYLSSAGSVDVRTMTYLSNNLGMGWKSLWETSS